MLFRVKVNEVLIKKSFRFEVNLRECKESF